MVDYTNSEISVIGSILVDARCPPDVRRILPGSEAFGIETCADVYRAACELADDGQPVDPVTIRARCPTVSREFLVQAMEVTPTAASAGAHAARVLEGWKRRTLADIGRELMEGDETADELLTQARAALDKLAEAQPATAHPGDDMHALLQLRAEMEDGRRTVLRSGFPALDGVLGGFQPGGLYIIAARPSVGKSAFGIAVADMFAARGRRVSFLSLEMSGAEIAARRIAAHSEKLASYQQALFLQHLSDEENADMVQTAAQLAARPPYHHGNATAHRCPRGRADA